MPAVPDRTRKSCFLWCRDLFHGETSIQVLLIWYPNGTEVLKRILNLSFYQTFHINGNWVAKNGRQSNKPARSTSGLVCPSKKWAQDIQLNVMFKSLSSIRRKNQGKLLWNKWQMSAGWHARRWWTLQTVPARQEVDFIDVFENKVEIVTFLGERKGH